MGDTKYPKNHLAGTKVPKGGSSCSNCKWVRPGGECASQYFQEWNGSAKIPEPVDQYCSDWWEPQDGSATEDDIREAFARTLARRK